MDIRVEGAEQFRDLAKRLKQAGDKDLRRELFKGINRAVKPIRAGIRQSALDTLPSGGGLGRVISKSKIRVKRQAAGAKVGIRIIGDSKHEIRAMDRGRVRHPLYGNRRHWYTQTVPAGWWTTPTEGSAPVARVEILAAMDNVKRKIEG